MVPAEENRRAVGPQQPGGVVGLIGDGAVRRCPARLPVQAQTERIDERTR